MKRLAVLLLSLFSLDAIAQTGNITATPLPFSSPEIRKHERGANTWYGGEQVNIPQEASVTNSKDYYWRGHWGQIQNLSTGAISFAVLDAQVGYAIADHKTFNWGVFALYPGQTTAPFGVLVGGSGLSYPVAVHNAMQAEPVYKDNACTSANFPCYGGTWFPNYNSSAFRIAYNKLIDTIIYHLKTTSYGGVLGWKMVDYVEIRNFGPTGEWSDFNQATKPAGFPSTAIAADTTILNGVNDMIARVPDKRLFVPVGAFLGSSIVDAFVNSQTAYAIMQLTNSVGYIGIRRDCFAQTGSFIPGFFENNTSTYSGLVFNTFFLNAYKQRPWNNEPCSCCTFTPYTQSSEATLYWDAPRQARLYHINEFGNGNMYLPGTGATLTRIKDSIRLASKLAGHRVVVTDGNVPTTISPNSDFTIRVNYRNDGLTPVYSNWIPKFEFRTPAGTVVKTFTSAFNLKMFQPKATDTAISELFNMGAIANGNYNLYLKIVDTSGYKTPFILDNSVPTQAADGAYLLKSSIVVGGNTFPTAVISGPSSIILPTTAVTLNGLLSSDPDGTIASYLWAQQSGPNTATISAPTGSTSNFTGLVLGTYVFNLQVTDNLGGIGATSKTITVVAAPPAGINVFTSQTPITSVSNDGTAIELGMKFQSTSSGYINGVRFYKVAGNTGTHIGELYSTTGTLMASATFANETATGWQYVSFSSPQYIAANTTYTVAYWSSLGNYVVTNGGLIDTIINSPLMGLADGQDGSNGLFRYTTVPAVPNTAGNQANYWVDVYFTSNGSFTIGSQVPGTSVQLTSMAGHNFGDTAYILPALGGNYTNLVLKDIQGIVVTPLPGTRPSFTTTSQWCRIKDVDIGYLNLMGGTGLAVDASCGFWTNVKVHNIYGTNWPSTFISAHNNSLYTYQDSTTYLWNNVYIDSVFLDSTGQFIQGSFGTPGDNAGSPPDVYHNLNVSRIIDYHTNMTAAQGTGIRGICFHCSGTDVWKIDRSGRGASGDLGWFYGPGAWHLNGIHLYGGPGYVIRITHPIAELWDPWENILTNSFKGFGTQYGFANYQYVAGAAVAGKYYGPSTRAMYNTMVYQYNDDFGYWSTMYNFGQVPPGQNYEARYSVGIGIGENNNNANKAKMAVSLGGWTTLSIDTSFLYYFVTASAAKMDSLVSNWVLPVGTFPSYALTSTSPAYILGVGPANPYATADSRGASYVGNLGYLQGLGSLVPPPVIPTQIMIHKKGLFGWKNTP